MSTRSKVVTQWYFHCPECGFGDGELGHNAPDEMIWCEICSEERRHVRLKRWPVDEAIPETSGSLSSGDGAPGPGFRDTVLRRRTFLRGR
jgi:hypothetical protein